MAAAYDIVQRDRIVSQLKNGQIIPTGWMEVRANCDGKFTRFLEACCNESDQLGRYTPFPMTGFKFTDNPSKYRGFGSCQDSKGITETTVVTAGALANI
jgi:hypothetical protein